MSSPKTLCAASPVQEKRDRLLAQIENHQRDLISAQIQANRLVLATKALLSDKPFLGAGGVKPTFSSSSSSSSSTSTSTSSSSSLSPSFGVSTAFEDAYIASRRHLHNNNSRNVIGQTETNNKRSLPEGPDRVLDAPGLLDDFYLNSLDWSVRNMLAVALGPSVYLWNGADGTVKELMSLPDTVDGDQERYISSIKWIHDGRSIAVGTSEGLVQLWDVDKCRKLRTILVSPDSRVSSLANHRHILSSGSRNGVLQSHDIRVAKHLLVEHKTRGPHEVCGITWSPDGQQLAAGTNDNAVYIWNGPETANPLHILEEHSSAIKAISWCPWKVNTLATGGGSQDRTIKIWDTMRGNLLASTDTGSSVSSLLWARPCRELVASHGLHKNHISLWKYQSSSSTTAGNPSPALLHLASLDGAHDGRILNMCFGPDGKTVATSSADESIKFWSLFPPKKNLGSSKSKENIPNDDSPLSSPGDSPLIPTKRSKSSCLSCSSTAFLNSPFSLRSRYN